MTRVLLATRKIDSKTEYEVQSMDLLFWFCFIEKGKEKNKKGKLRPLVSGLLLPVEHTHLPRMSMTDVYRAISFTELSKM